MNKNKLYFQNEIKKIKNNFNVGKYEIAISKIKNLLKKNPDFIALYNILGISYQRQKKYEDAKRTFIKGLTLEPTSLDLLVNLANLYKFEKNYDLAEKNYKRILEINPNYVLALLNYGNLKNDLNESEMAISFYDKALQIDENNFSIHFNKAFILQAIGKFEDSIFHAKRCLELNKNFAPADALLSKMLSYKENKWHIESMVKKVKDENISNHNLYNLNFAIGNAYEKINENSLSIKHIINANKIKRSTLKFNIEDEIQIFSAIKLLFNDLDFNSIQIDQNLSGKGLIFILGMPRSGTSLVEQIISTHSKVFGAGELFTLANIIKRKFFEPNNKTSLNKESIKKINFSEWQREYVDYLGNFVKKEKYLTDKNPLNFLWIGFIKIIFPKAKIVHCKRSPEETCLSIYKNNFPGNDLGWTYNQNELGNYYNLYSDLMAFWHKLIPNYIHDIVYEDLIENQKELSKSLIKACGLEWEDNCLNFHKNTKPIKTLSVTQARKKIYKSSLNLSKNYESELSDLFSVLSK